MQTSIRTHNIPILSDHYLDLPLENVDKFLTQMLVAHSFMIRFWIDKYFG